MEVSEAGATLRCQSHDLLVLLVDLAVTASLEGLNEAMEAPEADSEATEEAGFLVEIDSKVAVEDEGREVVLDSKVAVDLAVVIEMDSTPAARECQMLPPDREEGEVVGFQQVVLEAGLIAVIMVMVGMAATAVVAMTVIVDTGVEATGMVAAMAVIGIVETGATVETVETVETGAIEAIEATVATAAETEVEEGMGVLGMIEMIMVDFNGKGLTMTVGMVEIDTAEGISVILHLQIPETFGVMAK